ncbi:uncharacterized protein METZ01_LOCUS279477, partial [marine metagenome]
MIDDNGCLRKLITSSSQRRQCNWRDEWTQGQSIFGSRPEHALKPIAVAPAVDGPLPGCNAETVNPLRGEVA